MEFPLGALAIFAFATSITPGPNNIMLASSGVRFGFARTLPHLFGVCAGFAALAAMCALGLGAFVLALPAAHLVLKTIGSVYLLYFAWQLRVISLDTRGAASAVPMSFEAAALFQFANPKAWVMAVTGAAAFMPASLPAAPAALLYSGVYAAVNLPCIAAWALLGALLRKALEDPARLRWFSIVLIAMTVYSALAMWL